MADSGTARGAARDPAARIIKSLLGYGIIAGPRYVAAWLAQARSVGGMGLGGRARIYPENFLADVSSPGLVVRGKGRGRTGQTVPRRRKVLTT